MGFNNRLLDSLEILNSRHPKGGEGALVFGFNRFIDGLHDFPHPLVDLRTNQHFSGQGTIAIARGAVDSLANNGEFHPV